MLERVLRVKRDREEDLRRYPGVIGVGVGQEPDGRYCIRVYLATDAELEAEARLPPILENVPVMVERTGSIVALDSQSAEIAKVVADSQSANDTPNDPTASARTRLEMQLSKEDRPMTPAHRALHQYSRVTKGSEQGRVDETNLSPM